MHDGHKYGLSIMIGKIEERRRKERRQWTGIKTTVEVILSHSMYDVIIPSNSGNDNDRATPAISGSTRRSCYSFYLQLLLLLDILHVPKINARDQDRALNKYIWKNPVNPW